MTKDQTAKKPCLKALIVSLILCTISILCAVIPLHIAGDVAAALELDSFVVTSLNQLKKAEVVLPWWMLLPGTLLIMLPVYRMCKTKRFFVGFLCFFPLIIFQLAVWVGSMCTMYVNKIPIATAIRIQYNWAMNGAF